MVRECCPFHAADDEEGTWVSDEVGYTLVCTRAAGHPDGKSYEWQRAPEAPGSAAGISDYAEELGLDVYLPEVVARYKGTWVEYGVIEHDYATGHPEDFAQLVEKYGHTAIVGKRYTTSAFLGGVLGRLAKAGDLAARWSAPTGRWTYNSAVGYYATHPEPERSSVTTWTGLGLTCTYVPGQTEEPTAHAPDAHGQGAAD